MKYIIIGIIIFFILFSILLSIAYKTNNKDIRPTDEEYNEFLLFIHEYNNKKNK